MSSNPTDSTAEPRPSYRRLISGGGLLFVFRIGGAAVTYLTQVFMARWLGSDSLGIYVEAFAWALIISILAGLGLGAGTMRFGSKFLAHNEVDALRGYIGRTREVSVLAGTTVAIGGASLIYGLNLLPAEEARQTFILALACVPGLALLRSEGRISHVMSWFNLAFFPTSVLRPAIFFAAIAAAHYLGRLDSAATSMALHLGVIVVVAICVNFVVTRKINATLPKEPRVHNMRIWLRAGLPLAFISLFVHFFAELNIVISGFFVSPAEVAIFNAAFRTAMLIGFGLIAIDAFNMPNIMTLYGKSEFSRMQSVIQHAGRLKFVMSLIGFLGFALFGRWILSIFGQGFVAGYMPLLILGAAQVARGAIGPVGELLSFSGHQDRCLLIYLAGLGMLFAVQFVLIPAFGIIGAAIAAACVIVLSDLWLRFEFRRLTGVNPSIFGRSDLSN